MAEPFLSEIRLMSFVFPPKGWALCNGQLLPINQNQALFSLLGTTFGGDGRTNFALPDMRGRVPIHVGSSHVLGERGGEQAHTLSVDELPDAQACRECRKRRDGWFRVPEWQRSWRGQQRVRPDRGRHHAASGDRPERRR